MRRRYPLILVAIAALLSVVVYSRLPERVAVHWDLHGNPNGWMPRAAGAFFAPVFMFVLWQFMRVVPRLDPRADGTPGASGAYEAIVAATLLVLLVVHVVVLAIALGYDVPVARLAPALVGALLVVIGVVLPRTQPNRWIGVRTPWALSSADVWARTHRFAGRCLTVAGVASIVAAALLPPVLTLSVLVAAIVAATLAPVLYSWLTSRRR
ncbi:MAG TPA: SdpI family protein [Gemmatimonadaceae bacterium]|jgi:uncharacterized membrane protein|nr:SdpI family protein [Gemmatimonadaceae bacterium]